MYNTLKRILFGFAIFTSFNASADDDHLYLGLGFAVGSGTEEREERYISTEADFDHDQTSLIIGYQFPSQKRMELSYTTIDLEADATNATAEYTGVDIDWHFPFELEANSIQPYLGVGFGFYEYEDTAQYIHNGDDLEGVAFNVMAGLFIPVNENIEFELAYKIKVISWQTIEYVNSYNNYGYYESYSSKVDITSALNSFAVSARYKF